MLITLISVSVLRYDKKMLNLMSSSYTEYWFETKLNISCKFNSIKECGFLYECLDWNLALIQPCPAVNLVIDSFGLESMYDV